MKRLATIAALLLASAACESQHSKLDGLPPGDPGAAAEATPVVKAEHGGDTEARLRRLEDAYAKNAEALDFLNKVYAQQKAQQDQQENSEPAPDAIFAVNVADDVKGGQVEGPSSAMVTIVEAWDFA